MTIRLYDQLNQMCFFSVLITKQITAEKKTVLQEKQKAACTYHFISLNDLNNDKFSSDMRKHTWTYLL